MPKVSITIPTRNAASVLPGALASIRAQTFPDWEVILIDAGSEDGTAVIAERFGARILFYYGGLLGARCLGAEAATGELVLLMDADQLLEPTALARGVALMEDYDMLVLEEQSWQPRGLFPRLLAADRRLIHTALSPQSFDPLRGTVLPRLFRKEVLLQAIASIRPEAREVVVHHDHAVLYYEAYRISRRVGFLPQALYHREPDGLALWQRCFRFGRSLYALHSGGLYSEIYRYRDRGFRPGTFALRNLRWAIPSFLLLLFVKTAWRLGYLWESQQAQRKRKGAA